MLLTGCPGGTGGGNSTPLTGGADPNETAATVNGKAITLEEVERVLKQQAQGQEGRLAPLELAAARLQILENLIQQEVMYQKAEKEGTVPTDEEVTAEFNRIKQQSGRSQEQFAEDLKKAGQTEASAREAIKKQLAVTKLIDKITAKIEPPKDSEIEAFYNGNKEAFVRRRGVRLAAIVIDPTNSGQGDTTTNETEATVRAKEIIGQLSQPGTDFAAVARERSEDASRLQGGDLGYITEQELKQSYPQLAEGFMNPKFAVGSVTPPVNIGGKLYIFKLQERVENEENLTLESPNVRQEITNSLINNRKQLLSQSYAAMAMNEAKIENLLAQKVVNNPNELSGARPAAPAGEANANTATNSNAAANTNSAANANSAATTTNTNAAKPAANAANANAAR
jgi:parvulin-like peptidyl-prolyl isomerase